MNFWETITQAVDWNPLHSSLFTGSGLNWNPLDSPIYNVDEYNWDPMQSDMFKKNLLALESMVIVNTWLVAPSLGARFSDYFDDLNERNGLAEGDVFYSVDFDIHNNKTFTDFVWPTAKLAGAAVTTFYTGILGASVAIPLTTWGEGQLGIADSESDYGKWALYIGAALGLAAKAVDGSSPDADTDDNTETGGSTSTPQGSGAGPGYPGSGSTTTETLQSYALAGKEVIDEARDIMQQIAPYMPKSAPAVKPAASTSTYPSGTAGVAAPEARQKTIALAAGIGLLFLALKKF